MFVLTIGTFFPKVIALVTLPILTGNLTKTEYGLFDLILTLVSLLLPIATLQIQSAAFRFLIDKRGDREKSSEIVTNIFLVTIPITLVVLSIVYFVFSTTSNLNRLLICAYYLVDIVYLALQQIARGLSYNLQYSIATIIFSSINMLSMVVLVSGFKMGLTGVLIAILISCLVASIYIMTIIHKSVSINVIKYKSIKCIKEMLSYSWPMVPNNLSNWVLSVSDRLVITIALGIEANAVYAVANKIPTLFSTLQGTFTMAWQENASIASRDADACKYYSDMYYKLYCFLSGAMGCLIAVTPFIFRILISRDYSEAYYQMPILFVGILFSCLAAFLGGIYVAKKDIKSVGITTMCAALCNLVIDVLLVKLIGIYAGSISTLVSYLLLTGFRMLDLNRKLGMQYKYGKMLCMLSTVVFIATLSYQRMLVLDIANYFIAIPAMIFFNKNQICHVRQEN